MQTTIFYFSTTGNSLVMARSIADGLGETRLISIPKIKDNKIEVTTPRIGIIFPVYAWGPPHAVVEFVRKLHFNNAVYVFAVATCGGTTAKALLQLQKHLQKYGADLNAGFAVKEGANMVADSPGFVEFIKRINKKKYLS